MNPIYKYNYNAVNELPFLTESFKGTIKKICIYDVFLSNSSPPFLRFLLEKNIKGELDFIYPFFKEEPLTSHNVLNFLKTFFESYGISFTSDIFHFAEACRLFSQGNDKGNDTNTDCYLFINISVLKLETNHLSVNMVLIDEIMNTKQMYNINIAEEVTNFFLRNNEFIYLKDEKERNIEIPKVVYVGKPEKTLEFTFVFGNTKSLEKSKNSLFGPYYYFTDFENAQQQIKEMNEPCKKGIVRFAIFTGKMLIPNEIRNEIKNNLEEDLTNDYNSVYFYNENENDNENPIFIVEDYYQQIPLSYNYFF
jgi:hypothetical protein